ncbi:MAG: SprB repeat-containing protein, partial [Flavobacteriales bacterium]|nr:SprB repeat-containing protein [Flavobacteriales bacterium]
MMRKQLATLLSLILAFTYSSTYSADFYWVNNSGNWDDAAHWSNSSGGNGGVGVPGANDNVYFDASSFTIGARIEFNVNAVVNNFNFSSAQSGVWFDDSSESHSLEVKGAFNAQTRIDGFEVENLVLSSFSPAIFKASKTQFRSNLEFKGNYTLQDALIIRGGGKKLLISSGIFKTNGADVRVDQIEVPALNSTMVDFSASTLYVGEDADFNLGASLNMINADAKIKHQKGIESGLTGTSGFDDVSASAKTLCTNGIEVLVEITSNYNGEDITCTGVCDATVLVTVITPVAGCDVCLQQNGSSCSNDSIVGISGDTTFFVYAGQCVGSYTFTAQDSCQEVIPGSGIFEQCSENLSITEPFPVVFSILGSIDPTCPDTCDGQAFVSASGGTGVLSVFWPLAGCCGQSGNPDSLCVGFNPVDVIDDNGCGVSDGVTILDPLPFSLNIVTTPLTCNGVCDGIAASSPSGGTGDPLLWTYTWTAPVNNPPAGQGTSVITGLCSGPGSLTTFDVNGCPFTETYTVTEPPPLIIDSINQVDLVCNNLCLGQLEVLASNGTGPYNYQWLDGTTLLPLPNPGNGTLLVTNLCAGDYVVEVTDNNGCIDTSQVFTIIQPPPITWTITPTDATCFGLCDGQVEWTVTGGTPGIFAQLFAVPAAGSFGFVSPVTGLCAGDYFVQFQDIEGCVQNSDTVTIDEQTEMTGVVTGTDPLCNTGINGEVVVIMGGGSGSYDWQWFEVTGPTNIGQDSINPAVNLVAGCYYAEITDILSPTCVVFSDTVCLLDPPLLTITTSPVDELCNLACNGSNTAVVAGGTGALVVTWDFNPVAGPVDPNNLCPGNYTATVTDSAGCIATENFTINPAPAVSITVVETQVSCTNACDGGAVATAIGGTGLLTVTWHDVAAGFAVIGVPGTTISSLCPGSYAAIVTDGNGCSDTALFILNNPTPLIASTTITDETCFGDCDGQILMGAIGGSGTYTFENITTSVGPGLTNPFTGLCQGDYDVVVHDATGCSDTLLNQSIIGPTEIILTLVVVEETCFGDCNGSITVTASGGAGGFSITWSGGHPPGSPLTGLCPSDSPVTVTITDASGC